MQRKIVLFMLLQIGLAQINAQEFSPLWMEFKSAQQAGLAATLPDFSYAGYHFSERNIPDICKYKYFNVTDYGAVPNDNKFDDDAIQKTIDAAQAYKKPAVVFFHPGRYLIAPDEDPDKYIRINKSNIILKGSGAKTNVTEIHQANKRINGRQFMFRPDHSKPTRITRIVKDAKRSSFEVMVADPTKLSVGQDIVISHKSEEFTKLYFSPLNLKPQWNRLFGEDGGMQVFEIHTISQIQGNKILLKNPIHLDIQMINGKTWDILTYPSIEECGVEDILFTSNWKTYPEEFIHHKDQIHDYAYEAIGMEFVKNSWVQNCIFQDWNEGIHIKSGYQVSILNTHFRGKKGHASVHARTGYGVLIKNCNFSGAQHHGAGTGYSAVNTVITQCSLGRDQNFDIHSGQPIATLYDAIEGGVFYNLGGPEPGYPHHGRDLILWNFNHMSDKDQHYNFWDETQRRNNTIAKPILVGFTSNKIVTFENAGLIHSQNKRVLPYSLFEAQLKLRLKK